MSSINVYLKTTVQGLPGFKSTRVHSTGVDGDYDKYTLPGGISLRLEQTRWFITMGEMSTQVPEILADQVDEVTLIESLPEWIVREPGVYRPKEGLEAIIDRRNGGKEWFCKVFIRGENLEDVLDFYHCIRVGDIQPDEIYQAQPGGISRLQLEQENVRLKASCKEAVSGVGFLEREIESLNRKIEELRRLTDYIEDSSWPVWFRSSILIGLRKILALS